MGLTSVVHSLCQVKPVKYCMLPFYGTQHICYACLFIHCTTPITNFISTAFSSIFNSLQVQVGFFVCFLNIDESSGKQTSCKYFWSLKLTCYVAVKHILELSLGNAFVLLRLYAFSILWQFMNSTQ